MEKNKEKAFLSVGFHSWNKATTAFRVHQKLKCHLAALSFKITIPRCGNVKEMSNESMKADMKENRKCLIKILETLQFLGRQGLALRGDANDENSNFTQLFKLRSKDFVIKLNQWFGKKTDKYTSHDIQNELFMLMANQILSGMTDQIRGSYFSIICDEYTDISNKEELTFFLRWVDESFNESEDYLGFYEVPNVKSDTIVSAIRDIMLRTQISMESCRGQC